MYIKQIIFIFLYFQIIHAYNEGQVLTKNEVLKLINQYDNNFYCKNNTCVAVGRHDHSIVVNIPNENGDLIPYIAETCTFDDAIIGNCKNKTTNENGVFYSSMCDDDSKCLSNKCIKSINKENNYGNSYGFCVFNEENPIIYCDFIYTPISIFENRSSYMHCGKKHNSPCQSNDECSSLLCINKICQQQDNGPSDSEGSITIPLFYISSFLIIPLLIIIACCWCCCRQKRNNFSKIQNS